MGNCQAAEAATVLIQHPCGRVERVYWSVRANQVMTSNPGHYVAVIITTTTTTFNTTTTSNGSSSSTAKAAPVKYLKLLRPDDTLHLGHVYRLVSFEEVLKEFATKKHVKLSRLLVANKDQKARSKREGEREGRMENAERTAQVVEGQQVDAEAAAGDDRSSSGGGARISGPVPRTGQWRPALQSIAEIGS